MHIKAYRKKSDRELHPYTSLAPTSPPHTAFHSYKNPTDKAAGF